ncbi:MAG TPA: protein kinase [Kofleriaceae bacterium]
MDGDELDVAVRDARPSPDELASRVVRARVLARMFKKAEPVRVGRYELEETAGRGGGGIVFAASDPELSRRVAIKLVHAAGRRERVLAEAHALAKLAHPNVVPIFDVGTEGDHIFLVMELVDGETLRGWIESAPRSVAEIVRAYREAGEGLAAAHRAGFVHRDFKPDNALVGSDGRVRVVDFGLVHAGGETATTAGTPAYMAPEAIAGGEISAATDQYAFCASLRETLERRHDRDGARVSTVPRWLDAITARGTTERPEDRYPSLAAVLAALVADDPARRWRRRGLAAAVATVGIAAFVVGRAGSDDKLRCSDGRDELAGVWDAGRRSELAAHLATFATPYARTATSRLLGAFDTYAGAWAAGHQSACSAHARGKQSDALLDRRMQCLGRARAALTSAVDVARRTDANALDTAVASFAELPPLERCADAELLGDRVELPPVAQRAAIDALDREVAALEVEVRVGGAHHARVGEASAQLVARARTLGYRRLLARALRLVGVAALARDAREDAIEPLREATTLALVARDDELGVEAFARGAWAEGTGGQSNATKALAGLHVIKALAARLPDGAYATRALLANNVGSVELAGGSPDRARTQFQTALDELARAGGAAPVELAQIPANLALVTGDARRRRALFADTIARLTTIVGAEHPLTLTAHFKAARYEHDPVTAETVQLAACTKYSELHPTHGRRIGTCAFDLGSMAFDRSDDAVARRWFEAVVDAGSRGAEEYQVDLARAHLARIAGDRTAAVALFQEVLDEYPAAPPAEWWQREIAAHAELGIGLVATDREVARTAVQRAVAIYEETSITQPGGATARRLARARRALAALTDSR